MAHDAADSLPCWRMRNRLIYACTPRWAEVAARAEELLSGAGFEPVKDEAKTRAGFITLGDGSRAFIKRFEPGTKTRRLWRRVRGSRARRSIRGAQLLEIHGFRCPKAYAAIETVSGAAVNASYLINEPLDRAKILSRFINLRGRRKGDDFRWRRDVLCAVAREIRRLHDAGLFSSDLQETNLMLEAAEGVPIIYFVDLDGFRRPGKVAWRLRARNLIQLDRSIGRFLTRSMRLRFLYAYMGRQPARQEARKVVSRLVRRRAREDRKRAVRKGKRTPRVSRPIHALPSG